MLTMRQYQPSLMNRGLRSDLCDCYMGDVPTNPNVIEETKMGHHRSVRMNTFTAFMYLTRFS